jgi:hypothetical protein
MTDAGMTGDYDSIIGMQEEEQLRRFTSGIPSARFEPALGVATLSGVAVGPTTIPGSRCGSHRCGWAESSSRHCRVFGWGRICGAE